MINLKRIRVDPDGLITQDQNGFLSRIKLEREEIGRIRNNCESGLKNLLKKDEGLKSFFNKGGSLGARVDIIAEERDFLNRPLRVYYGIEPRCNLACDFCGPRDFHEGFEPASEEVEDLLLQEIADAGALQVQLTGGEIGIRGYDLLKTIEKTKKLGLGVILATNGVWNCIDNKEGFIKKLAAYGNIIQSKISIEGTPKFHESIRRKGSYKETIDTLEKLSKYGLNPRINTTIFRSSCNFRQLEHLVKLARKYSAGLQTIPLRVIGKASGLKEKAPSREQLLRYTKQATKLRQKTDVKLSFNFDIFEEGRQVPIYDLRRGVSCGAPLMGPHITHKGETYPCGFVQEVPEFMMGKIKKKGDLLDIWLNSEVINKVRYAGKPNKCYHCPHYGKGCWGGCWVSAWVATGKIDGMDPYCLK